MTVRPSLANADPIELEAEAGAAGGPGETIMRIMRAAHKLQASDVHLRVGTPPIVRLEGELRPLNHPPLDDATVASAARALAEGAGVPPEKMGANQLDFSCVLPGAGRFRAHMYRQSGSAALVLRRIQDPIPDFASLRLPAVLKRIAMAERGLVLVVGATGNGKSTTIAAMLEFINTTVSKHIVTCEDPAEFIFQDKLSTFSQREVGRDVDSFEQGLHGSLREDPDVLFIGEIRTTEAMETAINAAESGRLVISTSHAQDSARTIQRMINLYPVDFRESARGRLADVIVAIVAQRLVQRKNAKSRVLCTEVLTGSPTVKECIRDPARFRG
ncbi:MAG TPA: PilT/PilU family type 4a pilus ATPase, partial [Polyangiales bacterium]|nr:PilT/PilU family type 4a pilus ATPase [Polyangiales bacterium]